jgi:A/G-specific adenine glycosylase
MVRVNPYARTMASWYAAHARDLPWRAPDRTPWGVLVSEIMLQQTPVCRVEPAWRAWLARWPVPAALAAVAPAEAIRAWGRLGYPRRALRLHECACQIVDQCGGQVPDTEAELRQLPGIGAYTAAAVASFAFGRRAVVVDVNIARVLTRLVAGVALPEPSSSRAERELAVRLLPSDSAESVSWNQAVMELGALVCRKVSPACGDCPLIHTCRWVALGRPADTHADRRRVQGYEGTDRQARGRVLALLRESPQPVPVDEVIAALPREAQARAAVKSLVKDGLVVRYDDALLLPEG